MQTRRCLELALVAASLCACELVFPIEERAAGSDGSIAGGGAGGFAGAGGGETGGSTTGEPGIRCGGSTICSSPPCCAMDGGTSVEYQCKSGAPQCTIGDGYRCDDAFDCRKDGGTKFCCGQKEGKGSYCQDGCTSLLELCNPDADQPCADPTAKCEQITGTIFPESFRSCQ